MLDRIGRNLDIAVGLVLALAVGALSAFGVAEQQVVSAVILALLALVLSVFFRIRMALERINADTSSRAREIATIAAEVRGNLSPASVFRSDYPDLSGQIGHARAILVVAGGSLRTSTGTYAHQFRRAIQAGADVRLACPDPENLALMSELAIRERTSLRAAADDVQANIRLAGRLLEENATGSIEIRRLSHLPPIGVVSTEGRGTGGNDICSIWVKVMPFAHHSGAAPVFGLTSNRDGDLFQIVRSSIEAEWESGDTISLTDELCRKVGRLNRYCAFLLGCIGTTDVSKQHKQEG